MNTDDSRFLNLARRSYDELLKKGARFAIRDSGFLPLREATTQEIHIELMRRTMGERILASLLAHQELWQGFYMDSLGWIKLRDLPKNLWNVDTLCILTPDVASAHQLVKIAEAEHWGADEVTVIEDPIEVAMTLLCSPTNQAIISMWWD